MSAQAPPVSAVRAQKLQRYRMSAVQGSEANAPLERKIWRWCVAAEPVDSDTPILDGEGDHEWCLSADVDRLLADVSKPRMKLLESCDARVIEAREGEKRMLAKLETLRQETRALREALAQTLDGWKVVADARHYDVMYRKGLRFAISELQALLFPSYVPAQPEIVFPVVEALLKLTDEEVEWMNAPMGPTARVETLCGHCLLADHKNCVGKWKCACHCIPERALGSEPACNFMTWTRKHDRPCENMHPDDQTQWCGRCLLAAHPELRR